MQRTEALRIVKALAEGADPKTGEAFPEDSPYQRPEVVRALFAAVEALEAAAEDRRDERRERRARRLPEKAGKAWSSAEDEDLKREFDGGAKVAEMAERHGRTPGAIVARLVRVGKISSREALPAERLEGVKAWRLRMEKAA